MILDDPEVVPIARRGGPVGAQNFPLVQCDALTIHKSQGSTYDCDVFVDIGDREYLGGSFVAMIRVKRLEQLFLQPFDFSRYQNFSQGSYVDERAKALERLDRIKYI